MPYKARQGLLFGNISIWCVFRDVSTRKSTLKHFLKRAKKAKAEAEALRCEHGELSKELRVLRKECERARREPKIDLSLAHHLIEEHRLAQKQRDIFRALPRSG